MDAIRRLTSLLLIAFCAMCIAAWAAWFNPAAFGAVPNLLQATMFPGDPFVAPLGFGFGSLAVAYLVYPPNRSRDD